MTIFNLYSLAELQYYFFNKRDETHDILYIDPEVGFGKKKNYYNYKNYIGNE